ncbi:MULTISPECIES: hypothetical protein [Pseudomonas]|uniref:phosphoribosyltransferase-like protein n=1 Tax=Pseudomonas TaxID=286 RepID=UPI000C12BC22|nr:MULTISPECIES: hypothetical protein [Pseudomonas]MCE1118967.1 hypothetical protein [Pseudomonas sp. NMI795_08]MDD1985849.1 hypothetical protein [Pseudomonas putida]HDS1795054.1 hypothetical protein [Pseudomonas putida]
MPFHVPDRHYSLYNDVARRFRSMLQRGVITGTEESTLDRWLDNFQSEEELYFAARILERLIFRSQGMIESSIDQLLHCVLPAYLRQWQLYSHPSIEVFLEALGESNGSYPLRFVGVDGNKASDTGKSGVVIIRHYKRHARINKSITCRPDRLNTLPEDVRCLVFVDDMLGTGKQFKDFVRDNKLAEMKGIHMVYCPFVAFHKGVEELKKFPWLTVLPIEVLDARHQFFSESANTPGLWAVDGINTAADTREFYDQLAKDKGIPGTTRHGLDLVLGFEHSTPNNSLSLLWAESENWTPLFRR